MTEVHAVTVSASRLPVAVQCRTIKALIAKGDHAADKAEQFYIAAGKHLSELKERPRADLSWAAYVEKKCGISRRRADELIMIADGRTTLEKSRADKAKSVAKSKGKKSGASSAGTHSHNGTAVAVAEEPEPGPEDELDEDPENFRTAFLLRVDLSIRAAVYTGPITNETITAARRVAAAWTKLADKLEESQ